MLADSNTILRTMQPASPQQEMARSAIKALIGQGENLCLAPQNLIEIWVAATRPKSSNGLGMTIEEAAEELARLKSFFKILPEGPALYRVWEALVLKHKVSGKPAYDARLVAVMQVHGERSVLTFNTDDFKRYSGIKVVHPADVIPTSLK